jgi:hypothetical protein
VISSRRSRQRCEQVSSCGLHAAAPALSDSWQARACAEARVLRRNVERRKARVAAEARECAAAAVQRPCLSHNDRWQLSLSGRPRREPRASERAHLARLSTRASRSQARGTRLGGCRGCRLAWIRGLRSPRRGRGRGRRWVRVGVIGRRAAPLRLLAGSRRVGHSRAAAIAGPQSNSRPRGTTIRASAMRMARLLRRLPGPHAVRSARVTVSWERGRVRRIRVEYVRPHLIRRLINAVRW